MVTYELRWEAEDGADGIEVYRDEDEALEDMEEFIQEDKSVTYASLTAVETFGGVLWDMRIVREFTR